MDAQSALDAHEVLQADAPHTYGLQARGAPGVHVPEPLQVDAGASVSEAQLAAPHTVPAT